MRLQQANSGGIGSAANMDEQLWIGMGSVIEAAYGHP
jgi:hypothetical protein